ncbi:hypothetical protein, partial [Puniceibacterium antarcticum]|uniref:hypothetical protein n=1 Tax=Puniceibacterium antarcticum TaxID=1206336 RepID=UPI00117A1F03
MTEALISLAAALGVQQSYVDQTGLTRATSPETAQALLAAMGHPVASEAEAQEIARHLAAQAQVLPRWQVCALGRRAA